MPFTQQPTLNHWRLCVVSTLFPLDQAGQSGTVPGTASHVRPWVIPASERAPPWLALLCLDFAVIVLPVNGTHDTGNLVTLVERKL